MSKKYIQIAFSILLLAGMALGFAIKDGAFAQDNPTTKLEAGLLTQLKAGPADFIVTMKEQADVSGANQLLTKVEKGQYVFDTLVATAGRTQTDLRAYLDQQGVDYQSFYVINAVWVKNGTLDLAQTLGNRSDIASVSSNHTYKLDPPINPQASTSEPQTVEPNISFINADDVWAMGITGQGTIMAGNDTGLDATHPAIAPHYRGCLNPPSCTLWDHNYNWYDAWAPSNVAPWDDYGHGTHTTGTMVGDDGAGNQIGVAPGAQTIHCKNMLGGGGDDAHFIICFEWDLAPWDLSGANPLPSMAPDAVNNSWGYGGGGIEAFRTVIDNLQAAGILVEVSAGNEGAGCQSLRSPGDYQEVLTTGSVDHSGQVFPGVITGFSSRGPSSLDGSFFPDIMAPGNGVRSALPGNQYASWSGTSMAGPHATALIGLIWSANPALRGQVSQTIDIIKETAAPLTGQDGSQCGGDYNVGPNNDWGYGTIDAAAAVQLALAMGGSGQLDGTVTDAITGDPILGANVHAVHEDGFAWDAETDVTGFYTMTVAAGTFEATASHPRYESATVSGIEVITDTVTTENFELTPRGTLIGYVTDFDNGFPLVEATVTSSDGQSTSTDGVGFYEMFLDEGTFVITATMEDYNPITATVDIVSGQETQQDFALKSEVAFIPSPVHVTLDWETTDTLAASLLNRQATDYAYEFREKTVGFNPIPLGNVSNPVPDGSPVVPEGASNNNPIQRYTSRINQADILVLTSTDVSGSIERVLSEEGLLYDIAFVPPVTGIDFSPYSVVIMGMDGGTFSVADIQALRTGVIDAGKRLIFAGGTCWVDFAVGVNDFLVLNNTGNYCWTISNTPNWTLTQPSHGLAEGLPDSLNFVNSSAAYYQIREIDPAAEVVGVNGDGVPMYFYKGDYGEGDFIWMIDSAYSSYWADPNDYAFFKQTLLNAINYTSNANVPWFSEVPVSGTVPAEGTIDVSMFFTATIAAGVNQPGDYLATLTVKGSPDLEVPVVMTVLPSLTMGQVKGTVTDLCTGAALEEVLVDIPTGVPITQTMTSETGQYNVWLEQGAYTFTFSLPGYLTGDYLVDIVAEETLVKDVLLVPDRPCITEEPKVIETWVLTGTDVFTTDGLTIGNIGPQDLNWEIREKEGGYVTQTLSIPASDGNFPRGSEAVSIMRAPKINGGSLALPLGFPLVGEPAFAMDVNNLNLVYIPDTTDPGNWNIIANEPGSAYFGGDFINGDFENLYVIDYYYNTLYTLNTTTGAVTTIGPSIPYGGETWTGLAGSSDGTMFGSSTNIARSTLYTIDIATGAATVVGEITNAPAIIDIATNASGDMYGYDIVSDVLVKIDSATGAGTVVGSLGFDANYAQGMDFEEESGVLYLAAFNLTTFQGELRIADTSTGNTVLVGAFPNGAEVDAFAFPTGGTPVDVPWIWETPISGTLAQDTTQDVSVYVTAMSGTVPLPLGTYTASLRIVNNDPVAGTQDVTVIMHIVDEFLAPTAEFSATSPVNVGDPTVFTNLSTGGVPPANSYEWDFGDGITMTVGTLDPVSHVYATFGTFAATLKACNSEGFCGTVTHDVVVLPKVILLPLVNKN